MKKELKQGLLDVLINLRLIDCTGQANIDTYVDDSIHIIQNLIIDIEKETALEVPVQEQFGENVKLWFAEEMANYAANCIRDNFWIMRKVVI